VLWAQAAAAIGDFIRERPASLFPVTREIIEGGVRGLAIDAFKATYRLQKIKRAIEPAWEQMDLLVTPTAPTIYSIAEVEGDPIQTNSNLGTYTNFMNLLDLCAVAVPAGSTHSGLPFGVTFSAPAFHDRYLLDRAEEWITGQRPLTVECDRIRFTVCGAHMDGLPLNEQITSRGGRFMDKTRSAPHYRFVALPGEMPKPGIIRQESGGAQIELEIWDMPAEQFGTFVQGIPPPLAMGSVELEDGSTVHGFVCEAYAATEAEDITSFPSWHDYLLKGRGA
jgi:allophanate hydrolase